MFTSQITKQEERQCISNMYQGFLKENVRCSVWTCRDPNYLILGARFSLDSRDPMIIFSDAWDPKRVPKTP